MIVEQRNKETKAKISDQQLIAAYQKGDGAALTQLFERHRRRVLRYIEILVKDDEHAQDIFQETFIKVVRFIDEKRYADNGKFLPWVLRIAHNQVIDHFRQVKSNGNVSQNHASGFDLLNNARFSEPNVEDSIISAQVAEDLRLMVDSLPDEQREVVIKRYFNGLSFKEIAEQTDVSINTALGRMRYALTNLRKMVQDKNLL